MLSGIVQTDNEVAKMNIRNEFQREGLSVAQACTVAGIGRTKIYELMANGSLIARKFGKRRINLRDDLRQFLADLPVVPRPSVGTSATDTEE